MSEEQTSSITTMEFQYPNKLTIFALGCYLVMLGLFTLFYFGKMAETFSQLFWFIAIVYAILMFSPLLGLLLGPWKRKKTIILSESGITVRGRFTRWDEIEKIQDGPWSMRKSMVRIKLKKKERKFFSLETSRDYLDISPAPFIYRSVLPAILTIRPDIPVGRTTKRCIADPEWAVAPNRWLIASLLLVNIVLLCALLVSDFHNIHSYLIIAFLLFMITVIIAAIASIASNFLEMTPKDSFIKFALTCPMLLAYLILPFAISAAEYTSLQCMIIANLIALLMALLVLFAISNLNLRLQVVILCILAGVPTGIYEYQKSQQWSARDISSLLCGDDAVLAIWGNNGEKITAAWYKDNGCVIDTNTLKQMFLPTHKGKIYTIWLDERFLVRNVKSTDNDNNEPASELWVYDFAKQQEFQMPTSRKYSVGMRRPVDYTGQHLAWIDYQQNVQKLRFYNIETMVEDIDAIELPKDVNLSGGWPAWVGEKEIVVYANPADANCNKKRIVLWLNLANNQRQLFTSSQSYKNWYSITDFRYALGVNALDNERYSVVFVDIEKDDSTLMGGDNIPLEAPETRRLFHVVETKNGAYLATFEFADGKDKLLYRVSKGINVLGVSSTGKYILLGFDNFFNFPIYTVIDTVTGRRHKINLPGIFSLALSPRSIAPVPNASPFSPDEHWLKLETWKKTLLFEIPDKW
jgi:hypothetical protein